MKWVCTILEGIAGFVIWSFVGWWIGYAFLEITDPSVKLSVDARVAIRFSAAAAAGLVMTLIYARRGLAAYEGRGRAERTAFGNVYAAMLFVLCAVGWAGCIFILQMPKGGH
jgi:hypothetical protein